MPPKLIPIELPTRNVAGSPTSVSRPAKFAVSVSPAWHGGVASQTASEALPQTIEARTDEDLFRAETQRRRELQMRAQFDFSQRLRASSERMRASGRKRFGT